MSNVVTPPRFVPKKKKLLFAHFGIGAEREYFVENLSMLLGSGMSIFEALEAVETGIRSQRMRRLIDDIRSGIEAGFPLWKVLSESELFSGPSIALVRIGEESGKLSQNLKIVAEQERKERTFRSRIRSAMLYPIFVLTLTLVLGIGIAWFILPKLATVFSQLHLKLPLITRVLIGVGTYLNQYGSAVIPLVILFVGISFFFGFFFKKTKFIGQAILWVIPGVSRLLQESELTRFGYLFGTLLAAGIPITSVMHSLAEATEAPRYKRLYFYLEKSVAEGNSFRESFANYPHLARLIPVPIERLVSAGERSGNLSETLLSIGSAYEDKMETTTKDVSTILEPILLVIVWLGVVSVALAVILPIYSLVGGLETSP